MDEYSDPRKLPRPMYRVCAFPRPCVARRGFMPCPNWGIRRDGCTHGYWRGLRTDAVMLPTTMMERQLGEKSPRRSGKEP